MGYTAIAGAIAAAVGGSALTMSDRKSGALG